MRLLVLLGSSSGPSSLLPALEFLDHPLTTAPLEPASLEQAVDADLVIVDATTNLAGAAQTCRHAAASDLQRPLLCAIDEGGLAAVKATWGFDDFVLPRAGPAEVETRMRLLVERMGSRTGGVARVGDLHIDEDTYVVKVRGEALNLTFREFELLKHLAQHPGRVFSRAQLLQEVWGYDYYGGTRTVDVHIRRLRAKLGSNYDGLIGTVRGVGYKLDPQGAGEDADEAPDATR